MQDDLQQKLIRCESRVNTRLRYVRKSVVITGSQKREVTVRVSLRQSVSVVNVSTDLNALNGVSITKDLVSGVV